MNTEEAKIKKTNAENEVTRILEKLEIETGLRVNAIFTYREKSNSLSAIHPVEHIKTNITLVL